MPTHSTAPAAPIVVDAVFFQLAGSGIARVWRQLFEEWTGSPFADRLLIVDRCETAPKYPGFRYLPAPKLSYADPEGDRAMLQGICDSYGAGLFISTYYTTPLTTPSVLMIYDMIPEIFGMDLTSPQWRQKTQAIEYASHYLAISKCTALDLLRFSDKECYDLAIAPCGCSFRPPEPHQVTAFRFKYGLDRPYFMLSGSRGGYKNAILFFEAFGRLGERRSEFGIVCTGGEAELEPDCARHLGGASLHLLRLSDSELACAYAGAVALAYPSLYEGFGMPPLEAMACGTSVITCPKASLPEVCGEAALYVDPDRDAVDQMYLALLAVLEPKRRRELVKKGLRQAEKFSWRAMARTVAGNLERWLEGGAAPVAAAAPANLQQAVQRAFGLFSSGDISGAQRLCAELIASGVRSFYPHYLSGVIACERKEWPEARAQLGEALAYAEGVPPDRVADVRARLERLP